MIPVRDLRKSPFQKAVNNNQKGKKKKKKQRQGLSLFQLGRLLPQLYAGLLEEKPCWGQPLSRFPLIELWFPQDMYVKKKKKMMMMMKKGEKGGKMGAKFLNG